MNTSNLLHLKNISSELERASYQILNESDNKEPFELNSFALEQAINSDDIDYITQFLNHNTTISTINYNEVWDSSIGKEMLLDDQKDFV